MGLLADPVVVLPHLTGAVLARYNPGQDVYSPGNPAIYSRLAKSTALGMSCIEQGPLWSCLELLLQCKLASRRGKVLLRHFVCR